MIRPFLKEDGLCYGEEKIFPKGPVCNNQCSMKMHSTNFFNRLYFIEY